LVPGVLFCGVCAIMPGYILPWICFWGFTVDLLLEVSRGD